MTVPLNCWLLWLAPDVATNLDIVAQMCFDSVDGQTFVECHHGDALLLVVIIVT